MRVSDRAEITITHEMLLRQIICYQLRVIRNAEEKGCIKAVYPMQPHYAP
jgi:hypothetical protein